MEHIDGIVKLAENEFSAIVQNGKFRSREEIDSVYKLMDIVKDSLKIECLERELDDDDNYGYSRDSYARGRMNARRDSRGRYSRDSYPMDGYYDGRRGYSRDSKDEYKENLRRMMDEAPDENTRQSIKRMLDSMN